MLRLQLDFGGLQVRMDMAGSTGVNGYLDLVQKDVKRQKVFHFGIGCFMNSHGN